MNVRADSNAYDQVVDAGSNRLPLTRLGAPLLYAHDASTFLTRLRGLHAHPPLGASDALVIRPCRSIQTYGMKYPIDVVFLDRRGMILKLAFLEPSCSAWCFKACIAVEMCDGAIKRLQLQTGQCLLPDNGSWT